MAELQRLDITEDGLSVLLPQFNDSANMRGFLKSVFDTMQPTEDGFIDVLQGSGLDTAEGVTLNLIGELLGVLRGDLTDDEYRSSIKARIAVNRASGTLEDIISLIRLVLGNTNFIVNEYYPAEVHVRLLEEQNIINQTFVDDVTPAGVGSVVMQDPDGEVFVPGNVDTATNTTIPSPAGVFPNVADLSTTNKVMTNVIVAG